MTLILYFAANATIESKVELLTKLNESNLPLVSEFSKASIAMLKVHSELTHLLLVSINDPDEEEIYMGGRNIIDHLYEVEQHLFLNLDKGSKIDVDNLVLTDEVKEAFTLYKQVVVSTIELVSVDPSRSREELLRANNLLNKSYKLLIVLSNYYIDSISERSLLIEESIDSDGLVGVLTGSLLFVMIITSLYFASRMSSSIEIINKVMVQLGNGDTNIVLPENKDKYLSRTFSAVTIFRDTLQKNESQQDQLRNAVEELQRSKERYFDLLDIAASAIVVLDQQLNIILFNKAAQALFGYEFSEVAQSPFFAMIVDDDLFNPQQIIQFIEDDQQQLLSFEHPAIQGRKKSKQTFFLTTSIAKQKNTDGYLVTLSISDISERMLIEENLLKNQDQLEILVDERTQELQKSLNELKQTQGRLIESEKMASLGGLVAGVAHEINTPVGIGITSSSQLEDLAEVFSEKFNSGQLSKKDLEKFITQVQSCTKINLSNLKRAAGLISSFKEISVDQSTEEVREVNLKDYTDDILTSLHTKFKNTSHTISFSCPPNILMNSVPGIYSQIITNFLMNSLIHGFENKENGEINIDITQQHNRIFLHYQDNGCGMSKEQLAKIYEPFFTSKRSKGSTGLGMHIVYNLVSQKLAGSIKCTSEVGEGIKIEIEFPRNLQTTIPGIV